MNARASILAIWLVLCASTAAADVDNLGPGLDLLVVVDRSASMISRTSRRTLLDHAFDVVLWNAISTRTDHRFGIVTFATSARIDVPLTGIRQTDATKLRCKIGVVSAARSHGTTDLLSAFEMAAKAFASLPADSRRRRAIVLVSDGVPYGRRARSRQYVSSLRRVVAANFGTATMDALLIGREYDETLWQDITRRRVHQSERDHSETLAVFHRIITKLVGTHAVEASQAAILLPPYLDFVVFDVLRDSPGGIKNSAAIFVPPGSEPLSASTNGVEEIRIGDVLSTFVIRRPSPGWWKFGSMPGAVRVFSQQFFPRGALVEPTTATPPDTHERISIAYRLLDGNGNALLELPQYPLLVDVVLIDPHGHRSIVQMKHDPESGPAFFRTTEPIECNIAGHYWTEVSVTTRDLDTHLVNVFRDRWSGFFVSAGRE